MIAAVYHAPGDVRVEDMPEPGEPQGADVVLEVSRAAICGTDASEFAHAPKFFPIAAPHPFSGHQGPTIMGHEFTGRVVALGPEAAGLSIGDRVVCGAGVSCGACEWCLRGRTNLCASYYTLGLHTPRRARAVRAHARVALPDRARDVLGRRCRDGPAARGRTARAAPQRRASRASRSR